MHMAILEIDRFAIFLCFSSGKER